MRLFVVFFSFFRTVCGQLSHLDVFIVVSLINSNRIAIVAEANLRCGDFLSKTSCPHSTARFPFFWSWLPDIPWIFTNLKGAAFLRLTRHCLLVNGTWECLVFDFNLFMCLSVMRFFSLQVFPFLITVSGWYYHFSVLIFIHLFSSTTVVVVALANLCWAIFVSKKLSKIGSFH